MPFHESQEGQTQSHPDTSPSVGGTWEERFTDEDARMASKWINGMPSTHSAATEYLAQRIRNLLSRQSSLALGAVETEIEKQEKMDKLHPLFDPSATNIARSQLLAALRTALGTGEGEGKV